MRKRKNVVYVKRNINTLEYPIWTPSRILSKATSYETENGYRIECSIGLPNGRDVDILNSLLYLSQQSNKNVLKFESHYDILKMLGYPINHSHYEILDDALTKWFKVNIIFPKGIFYSSDKKKTGEVKIHVLDHIKLIDGIEIKFNDTFLEINNEKYSRLIPLDTFRKIPSTPKRLYEVLIKNFHNRNNWLVGIDKVKDKLMIVSPRYDYDSHTIELVENSISVINKVSFYSYGMVRKDDNILFTIRNKIEEKVLDL